MEKDRGVVRVEFRQVKSFGVRKNSKREGEARARSRR